MKISAKLLLLIGAMVIFQHCTEEQTLNADKVRIEFTLGDEVDVSQLTDNRLMVTISRSSGTEFMHQLEVPFSRSGAAFVTEPLDVPQGNYVIDDFFLVNADDEVVFATPKINAPLGGGDLVNNKFTVTSRSVDKISLRLLSVVGHQPRDFGYESFRVKSGTSIHLGAKIMVNGKSVFTTAEAFLLNDHDTVAHYNLRAEHNRIRFDAEPNAVYELVIIKDGYSRHSELVSRHSLTRRGGQKPIIAELVPAFTMVIKTNAQGYFGFELDGFLGDIVIDWSDQTFEEVTLSNPGDIDVIREHYYSEPGNYFVSITGELDKIHTALYSIWFSSRLERINLDQLTNLWDLRFMYVDAPDVVDASNLQKLGTYIFWTTDVKEIKVSETHPPTSIELEGSPYVSKESFAEMIDDVYNHALVSGHGIVFISWGYQPDPNDVMMVLPVGSPDEETLNKMRILQNNYNTDFGPDVDYEFGSGKPW